MRWRISSQARFGLDAGTHALDDREGRRVLDRELADARAARAATSLSQ